MFSIGKTFSFAAAHHLPLLPPTHKCHNVHGHNYLVTYEVESQELDDTGFVVDYAVLTEHWRAVAAVLDHQDLNVVLPNMPPTAEFLARWLFEDAAMLPMRKAQVVVVRVQETPTTFAEYRP